uniref:Knottin scorpion toxin-like domain-containing protein n=1 Tax=Oryza brachyantha TaxID=4533 RepID=J3N1W3_ORYBR
MDARAAACFFLLLLVFQGNPTSADESCIFTSAHLPTCILPFCKFACVVDARSHHAKYKDGWCRGFFNGVCTCQLCYD